MHIPFAVVSASISGSNSALSIPGPVTLTGSKYNDPGGVGHFNVSKLQGYSHQAFLTGSGLNGMLYMQQSNDMTGWLNALSASVTGPGDQFFKVRGNNMAYARLLWSGSAGSGSTITVAMAGIE